MLQVALEQELEEFLGRAHYRWGRRRGPRWDNGYEPQRVKTAEGLLEVYLPRVRGTEEPFRCHLDPALGNGSDILGRLVSEMYLRCLSTRDVESMFIEITGERVLSRSGVSRITAQLQQDFHVWMKRDLSQLKVV